MQKSDETFGCFALFLYRALQCRFHETGGTVTSEEFENIVDFLLIMEVTLEKNMKWRYNII